MSQAIPITSRCLVLTEFEQEKVRLTPCRLMFYFHFLDGKNMFFFNVHSAQMDRCVNRFDKLSTWNAGLQTLYICRIFCIINKCCHKANTDNWKQQLA